MTSEVVKKAKSGSKRIPKKYEYKNKRGRRSIRS